MSESIVSLLSQLPIVGIFVWFILEWSRRMDKANAERDMQWRLFMTEERQQRVESMARLAEEIKAIAGEVSRLNGIMVAHDAASRERGK